MTTKIVWCKNSKDRNNHRSTSKTYERW